MPWKNEEELVREIKRKIFYFASRHIANRESAQDITQETLISFLEVYRSGGAANPENLGGLAYGIFRNKLANFYRQAKREEQAMQGVARADAEKQAQPDSFNHKAREDLIRKNLLRLKARDREILVLFFQENQSCQEISTLLGMAPHQVSVRKWRALKKMQKWLR